MTTVLLVGGAKGIGKATEAVLAGAGCRVLVADRDAVALGSGPGKYVCDIADKASVAGLVAALRGEGAKLDAVVVCAGVHATCPVEFLPDAEIDRVMEINFTAHVRLVRDLLPLVNAGGKIVGVSSIGATVGIPFSSLYSASKGALELFYEALATELAYRPVYPVIIQPGNVNTGFNETGNSYVPTGHPATDANYRRVVDAIDSSKGMPPAQVAEAIARVVAAPRPPLCVVVGTNALKAFWARRLLGRSLAVRLMAKFFGIRS